LDNKEKEMNKKILIAGFACLSVIAVAQSSGNKDQSASAAKDQHPRDVATGQASGKRQYQPIIIRKVSGDDTNAAREVQSPKATGKTTAQDDWHATAKTSGTSVSPADVNQDGSAVRESPTTSHPKGVQARVATGDVNGDGKADAAINNSHSNIKNGGHLATGQASGKRTATKEGATAQK
jgi:hypothetical protein